MKIGPPSLGRTERVRPASASVRFLEILTGPLSLRRTQRVRPASASVLFGRYFIGPWSASVLEADVSEKKLPSRVLYRPWSASVPGRPSPSRDLCAELVTHSAYLNNLDPDSDRIFRHSSSSIFLNSAEDVFKWDL